MYVYDLYLISPKVQTCQHWKPGCLNRHQSRRIKCLSGIRNQGSRKGHFLLLLCDIDQTRDITRDGESQALSCNISPCSVHSRWVSQNTPLLKKTPKTPTMKVMNVTTISLFVTVYSGETGSVRKRSVFQMCALIQFYTGNSCYDYNDYGCFCGYGQVGYKPVDRVDRWAQPNHVTSSRTIRTHPSHFYWKWSSSEKPRNYQQSFEVSADLKIKVQCLWCSAKFL